MWACVLEREIESQRITGRWLKEEGQHKERAMIGSECFQPHEVRPLSPFVFSGSSSQRLCSSPFFSSLSVPSLVRLLLSPVNMNATHLGLIAVYAESVCLLKCKLWEMYFFCKGRNLKLFDVAWRFERFYRSEGHETNLSHEITCILPIKAGSCCVAARDVKLRSKSSQGQVKLTRSILMSNK